MNKMFYKLLIILCSTIALSCSKVADEIGGNTSTTAKKLSITTQAFDNDTSVATRGVESVEEYTAMNYWVLQFGSDGAKLSTNYYSDADISTLGVNSSATTIWVVANTFSTTLFSSVSTLSDFQDLYFELTDNSYRESGMWVTSGSTNYLRMSGKWEGTVDGSSDTYIGITLKPLAAKITFTYSCPDNTEESWVEISSVQLKSVPQYSQYSTEANVGTTLNNMVYTPYQEYFVSSTDVLGADSGSYTFYLPQNLQGTVTDSESAAEKSGNAPTKATYITLTGTYYSYSEITEQTENNNIEINIYPGENSVDNYDICVGKNYNVNCTISCDYNSWFVDSRVVTTIDLPEGAVIHYEFDPDDLSLNSAYDDSCTSITASYIPSSAADDYPGTTGIDVYSEDNPFIRNLAAGDNASTYDCTLITDSKFNYTSSSVQSQLSYTEGNKYISSSLIALATGWGEGYDPATQSFTIVFIGSCDDNLGPGRNHIYTTSGSSEGRRWYFMRFNEGNMKYGLQGDVHQEVPSILVSANEVFLSFDIANSESSLREVYFNNIKLADAGYTSYSLYEGLAIFGNIHTTSSSTALEANDGRTYLFLVYEKALSTDEIDQIKTYATLKGLI